LNDAVPAGVINRGKKLVGLEQHAGGVSLSFADGTTATADMLIGADGVHSKVREKLFGAERPRYSGRVAYRSTFSTDLLNGREFDPCTKWWGPDRHIVIYYITRQKDEMYFVTSLPEPDWTDESWSQTGDMNELRSAFSGFHEDVRAFLDACPVSHKWAIVERDPMPRWSSGRVVLLGDSCHPMTPYMAQGAATSMEDAAVLWRCIDDARPEDLSARFDLYEATRKPRTSQVQLVSHQNTWLHRSANTDWVFGYDAWNTPLGRYEEAKAS
jgi:salicylate hydroxylase/6-hydroxynicotinate 3-monooxygenase